MKSVAENTISSSGQNSRFLLEDCLRAAWSALGSGDFEAAENEATKALEWDFADAQVLATLKCAVFWKERRAKLETFSVPEARGDFLLRELTGFQKRFSVHLDAPVDEAVDAIRHYVYTTAAQAYVAQLPFETDARKAEVLIKAARALKGNGSFDQALGRLEEALNLQKDDAVALAEMGDCFDMTNEARKAKLFFREAFYLNAAAIDPEGLRSTLIRDVLQSLSAAGYTSEERREWLPVYAVLQGAFNVKRELKPLELGHLKQSINALKTEVQAKSPQRNLLVPRLINRYFWLIDHYLSVKEERSKIDDVLLNIKLLDPHIHELYTH